MGPPAAKFKEGLELKRAEAGSGVPDDRFSSLG
jgi:hypothetical protein